MPNMSVQLRYIGSTRSKASHVIDDNNNFYSLFSDSVYPIIVEFYPK